MGQKMRWARSATVEVKLPKGARPTIPQATPAAWRGKVSSSIVAGRLTCQPSGTTVVMRSFTVAYGRQSATVGYDK